MVLFLRAALYLAGLFFLLLGLGFLINPVARGVAFGLSADSPLGNATMRGDFTAFFVVGAVWLLWGAWKRNGDALLVPAALFGLALLGRCVTLATVGGTSESYPPMAIEAVMLVLTLIASRVLPHRVAA